MKTILQTSLSLMIILSAANLRAAETNAAPARIGLYDSRAVAFAWFSSDAHQRQLKQLIQNARAVQAAGDTNRFQTLAAELKRGQDGIHREGFSTAPPTEALAEINGRIPEIEKQAGISVLVSRWDKSAFRQYPNAETVDVTDRLVQEFKPTEKQLKTISTLEKSDPLPLDKCNELIRQNKI